MALRIVITGAPASGKTEFFERLKKNPYFSEFTFFEELARKLLTEFPYFRHDRSAFHREIYRKQTDRENALAGRPFISDRGTIDAFAFHPETIREVDTSLEKEYERYDLAILLGSAAVLGKDFYRKDEVRLESPSDALEIEKALNRVWRSHPNFHKIAAEPSLETKYDKFLKLLTGIIDNEKRH